MNESCYTYEWVMLQVREKDPTINNERARAVMGALGLTGRLYVWHICVMWLFHMCHMTYSCVRQFTCVTWLIPMCDTTRSCVGFFIRVTCMCGVTLSHVSRDLFVCGTRLVRVWGVSRSCVRLTHSHVMWIMGALGLKGPLMCMKWLFYMCDRTHLYTRHDTYVCVT